MREIALTVDDDVHEWLTEVAQRKAMTVAELVLGLIASERGDRYVLPDGRHFGVRAAVYRNCKPSISPGASRL